MPNEARSFRGIPETAAHYQPLIAPRSVCKKGVFIGTNLRTRWAEFFDPWWLKVAGVISGAIFLITGDRNAGKSAFMKALALRLLRLQAAMLHEDEENGEYFEYLPDLMRVQFHSRKTEKGESEFQPVTEFLHSRVHALNHRASFNIYDPLMGMTEYDLIEVTVNVCESVKNGDADAHEVLAIMVGIRIMCGNINRAPQPEILEHIIRTQTMEDLNDYYRAANTQVAEDAEQAIAVRPATLPVELGKPVAKEPPLHHVTEQDFLAASARVAIYLGRLLRGDYGGIIGGSTSLSEVLQSQVLTLDWTDVNAKVESIMQSMLMRWQMSALNSKRMDLIPHLIFNDEVAEAMPNLMFVRSWATRVMKSRAFPTADFTAAQYRNQVINAGEAGSEIRSLARSISLGIGAEFLFRQPDDPELLHDLTQRGFSELDAMLTTQLGLGEVAIKYPDEPVQLVQLHIGKTIQKLVPTNSATENQAKRHSIYEFAVVQERLARLRQQMAESEPQEKEGVA